jgi:hypothetical protein
METTSTFSTTRPPPPPQSPPPRFGDRPNYEPFDSSQQEEMLAPPPPQQYMYYDQPPPPEPEKTFLDGISKKVLFVIFLAFIIGLFIGKFMSQSTVVIQPK